MPRVFLAITIFTTISNITISLITGFLREPGIQDFKEVQGMRTTPQIPKCGPGLDVEASLQKPPGSGFRV